MRRWTVFCITAAVVIAAFVAPGPASVAQTSIPQELAAGRLRPAVLHVGGVTKQLPSISGGLVSAAQEALGRTPSTAGGSLGAGVPGAQIDSLGCSGRNQGVNVRVNRDCTYRRQAEEHIAYNPTDHDNLVAGMNDSIIGYNQTSLDFTLDGGKHWGAISTAPFRYRLNAPNTLAPTADDPNSHTIVGGDGTLHSYDACSDPYMTFDSEGRAFYTCVAFDIVSNVSLVFAVPSTPEAKASYFDQVYPPFGLIEGTTGREHIVAEDNSPAAFADGPKIAADSYPGSPNRDVVYETWTNFDLSCPAPLFGYCESPIYASMSTDHGFTWSTPEEISGINSQICQFGDFFNKTLDPSSCNFNGHSDLAVLPTGDVVVSFQNGNTPTVNNQYLAVHCAPSGSSPAGTAHLSCGTPQKIADEVNEGSPRCNFGRGPEQCIPGAFIRGPMETSQRLSVDQRTGALFDTWFDYRSGEFDIWLSRSTDGGIHWSAARMVNPDEGRDHYFSSIDIGEAATRSHVGVAYYRTGRVPNENQTPEGGFAIGDPGVADRLSDFVLAGGSNLSTPFAFVVLSPKFPAPDGIQEGFNGDYTGLVVIGSGDAHPVWSDTRVQVPNPDFDHVSVDEDVFTARALLPG